MIELQWYIVLAAFILDLILGDPRSLPHPVVYMGKAIVFFESRFKKYFKDLFVSGLLFACFLILSVYMISFILIKISMTIHPVFGSIIQIILLFFCFSAKSLEGSALRVLHALENNNINKARENLSMIVGRQTKNLDQNAVARASIETIAENFTDGFLSPLFFAMIGGVPFALAYKMINTLDSMVGYKNKTYIVFGKASAIIDDIANFIPARLSVLIIFFSTLLLSFEQGFQSFKRGFFFKARLIKALMQDTLRQLFQAHLKSGLEVLVCIMEF